MRYQAPNRREERLVGLNGVPHIRSQTRLAELKLLPKLYWLWRRIGAAVKIVCAKLRSLFRVIV